MTRSTFLNGAQVVSVASASAGNTTSIVFGSGAAAGVNGISIGNAAGVTFSGAQDNIAIGTNALKALNNASADNNVAIGSSAGLVVTSGSNNVCLGRNAGNSITTGSRNTCIGVDSDCFATGVNCVAIGRLATTTSTIAGVAIGFQAAAAYGVTIGTNITSTNSYAAIKGILSAYVGPSSTLMRVQSDGKLVTTVSSRLYKDNITPLPDYTDVTMRLEPVQFRWDTPNNVEMDGARGFGLIAEDVYTTLPMLAELIGAEPRSVPYDMLALFLLQVVQRNASRIAALQ